MPFNGAGLFTRVYQWINDEVLGLNVDATRTDTDSNDIAAGLSNCITRDGQSPWLANLPAGGFKIQNLGVGNTPGDSVNYGQVFNSPIFVTPYANVSPVTGDNPLRLATVGMVNTVAFSAALPAQALGFLRSDGATPGFTQTHTGYAQKEVKGADIASAATINLTTATGNLVHVTGTINITGITIPVGAEFTLVFDDALTLTHSAAVSIPGATNITTATNDRAIVRGDAAGAVIVSYARFSGAPVGGYTSIKVSDRKASGTAGGASVAATISQTRTLNTTEFNTITGAVLSGNAVTLPPGTYKYAGSAVAYVANVHKTFLYNSTDGVYVGLGANALADTGLASESVFSGTFTITSSKNFTMRHYTFQANASGLGLAVSSGQLEVYAQLTFERIAS